MGKAAIFIDGAYLDNVLASEFHGAKIDYALLAQELLKRASSEPLRTYYYHCLPYQSNPPTEDERNRFGQMQGFFRALRRNPSFAVREGRLSYRGKSEKGEPIFEQKRIDLLLGLDLALLASKRLISDAILIAGDSDLIPSIEVAKSEGVVLHLVHGKTAHEDLLDSVDNRIALTLELLEHVKRRLV